MTEGSAGRVEVLLGSRGQGCLRESMARQKRKLRWRCRNRGRTGACVLVAASAGNSLGVVSSWPQHKTISIGHSLGQNTWASRPRPGARATNPDSDTLPPYGSTNSKSRLLPLLLILLLLLLLLLLLIILHLFICLFHKTVLISNEK